ncbi:MAG: hypothetical protein Q7W45_01605 [Bacteroidota bacterium]|nr:hypothetical protein [Bacteroidota bacterium]MDP3144538.1 hypothetical protein [Bacteroidota bacterium]
MHKIAISYTFWAAFCCCFTFVNAQSEQKFYKKKNYASLALGLVHNQPQYNKSNEYFKFGFIPDISFEIGITTFVTPKHGWQIAVGSSTKNYNIKFKDKQSSEYNQEKNFDLDNWFYNLKVNKTYSFNLTNEYNAIISSGPILFLNNRSRLNDSLQIQNSNFTFYNDLKVIGIGLNINLTVTRAVSKDKFILVSMFYQRGFVSFLQLTAVNQSFQNERIIYNYKGSGPGIRIGILM